MLDENKNDRSVKKSDDGDEKKNKNAYRMWNKEFNERFSSYLLISNIADGTKGISMLVWS